MTRSRDVQLAEAIILNDKPVVKETDWWRGAIFYQIYLRSFRDSDGDGIGDLRGVIEKLDYLADLGIDGIWLAPFYTSPQRDFGYDISDMRAVDRTFGSIEDLLELIEKAHDRDLKVLADFVPCHTSNEHPWFEESRKSRDNDKANWYVWADPGRDGTPPNNWLSSFGGSAWTWEPRRSQYYYHPFFDFQPALNLRNDETLQAVVDAMCFWRDLGIDGFRLDAVQCLCWDEDLRSNPSSLSDDQDVAIGGGPNNPFASQDHLFDRDVPHGMTIIERLRRELTDGHPEFALIGELADVDTSHLAVKYTCGDRRLHAVYDFDLIHKGQSTRRWIETLRARSHFIRSGWMMNVMTNHDSERAVSYLMADAIEAGMREEAAKLLLFLQATLKGGAIVFQGEELGLPQPMIDAERMKDPWGINLYPDFSGRDGVRTPFPWKAECRNGGFTDGERPWAEIPEEHLPLAADRQAKQSGSVLSFFRELTTWRRKHPFLRSGSETLVDGDSAPLMAFERSGEGSRVTFVVNLSPDERFHPCEGNLLEVPHCTATQGEKGIHLPAFSFAALGAGLESQGSR